MAETLVFIGIARSKGTWNASTNVATSASTDYAAAFPATAATGSYNSTNIDNGSASNGDYWQVATDGTTTVDGVSSWSVGDWIVFDEINAKWKKVSYTDTVGSIVVGSTDTDLLAGELIASSSARQLIYNTSNHFDGDSTLTYDASNNVLKLTGTFEVSGDVRVQGTYDTIVNHESQLHIVDKSILIASGATSGEDNYTAGAIDGAGIYIGATGSNAAASFVYDEGNDSWHTNEAMHVSGAFTVDGQLTASNGLEVTGTFNVANKVLVDGDSCRINAALTASDSILVQGFFTASNGIEVTGTMNVGDKIVFDGNVTTISSQLTASNGIELTGTLKLAGGDGSYGGNEGASHLEFTFQDKASIPTGLTDRVMLYASGSGADAQLYVKAGGNTQTPLGGASIANDSNDRITTALGDGTLNAEANLTFDGSTLTLTGSVESTGLISAVGVANSSQIGANTTVPDNYNAVLYGPITIADSYALRIGENSNVKIKDISDA